MPLPDRTALIQESSKDPIALSIFLLEENPGLLKCEKNIYLFNGKCYDLILREQLLTMLHRFMITHGITKIWNKRNDIIDSLLAYEKLKTVKKMNDYPDLLCLNNGIINIHTRELVSHSADYYFDSIIDNDYDPKALECPAFKEYLESTFNGDRDTIDNVIMLGGYLMDTSCAANKMFLFNGSGSNGKSVLIDTYSMFFSDVSIRPQVTSISLSDLSGDKFKKSDLITSRFNVCSEEKKGYIDAEEIKKIISGELINVRGLYRDTITFRPKTKIVIGANGLPKFTDTSDGIYRRLVIINFENQYKTAEEMEGINHIKEKRIFVCDLDLPDKIKSEKSAILNLFLDGLLRLKERKYQFILSKKSSDALTEFKRDSDTVREFLEDNYEIDSESHMTIHNVYAHYRQWYRANVQDSSLMKFRANEMGRRIKETFGIESRPQQRLYNTETKQYERVTTYGIRLIENDEEQDEPVFMTTEDMAEQLKQGTLNV